MEKKFFDSILKAIPNVSHDDHDCQDMQKFAL